MNSNNLINKQYNSINEALKDVYETMNVNNEESFYLYNYDVEGKKTFKEWHDLIISLIDNIKYHTQQKHFEKSLDKIQYLMGMISSLNKVYIAHYPTYR